MTERYTTTKRVASVAMAVAVVATSTLVVQGTAAAALGAATSTIATRVSVFDPVTWVDGEGRQYLVTTKTVDGASPGEYRPQLVAARDLADGTPDPTWGTFEGQAGVRALELEAPAADHVADWWMGADGQGLLTTTWRPSTCLSVGDPCVRVLARHDLDGNLVGTPVALPAGESADTDLDDGSLVTTDGTAYRWRSTDGTDLGFPDLGGDAPVSIVLAGSDLLVGTASAVVRWPAGGPAETVVADPCATDRSLELASAPDGGFATVCLATGATASTITRHEPGGTVRWSVAGVPGAPYAALFRVTDAVVDRADRVWIAGVTEVLGFTAATVLTPVAADGIGRTEVIHHGGYAGAYHFVPDARFIADLRPALGDDVAVAESHDCCYGSAGPTFEAETDAYVIPRPVALPICTNGQRGVAIERIDDATAGIDVSQCFFADARTAPDGYLVSVRLGSAAPVVTDLAPPPDLGFSTPVGTVATAAGGGTLVRATATAYNDAGSDPTPPTASTVLPFDTVDGFTDRQLADLSVPGADRTWATDLAAGVPDATIDPDAFVAELLEHPDAMAQRHVEPLARFYRAFFLRDADPQGLTYWTNARVVHGRSLTSIANQFARSNEFRTRYGSLNDAQFVAQLYRNVFDREPDPRGWLFWTNRLQTGRTTRGGMVVQFSESSEFRTASAAWVEPLATAYLMLGRLPTAAERGAWEAFSDHHRESAAAILATEEYATLIG